MQQSQPRTSLGKHWLDRFIKRHSELQTRFSQRLERQRSAAGNPRVLEHHFKLFQKALGEYIVVIAGVGLLWEVPIALAGRGVSVGSMLAIVTGVLLFGLGLLCDQISQLRLERFE